MITNRKNCAYKSAIKVSEEEEEAPAFRNRKEYLCPLGAPKIHCRSSRKISKGYLDEWIISDETEFSWDANSILRLCASKFVRWRLSSEDLMTRRYIRHREKS